MLSAHLLGRHVRYRTQGAPWTGQLVFVCEGGFAAACAMAEDGPHFRQSKVEDLCVTAPGDEDVRGFDVAMDYPCGVGRVQGVSDFDG